MSNSTFSENRPLAGRVALLTGATGALGSHLALALVEAGASLVACHHRGRTEVASRLAALERRAGLPSQRVLSVQADLRRPAELARAFALAEGLGGCDLLVNSASRLSRERLEETPREALSALVELNLAVPIACCQAAVAQMRGRGRGDIVNLVDVGGGLIPWQRGAAYCATRAGLAMLTRCLALELAPVIRVNALAPGLTELSPEAQVADGPALKSVPLGRPATVAEVVAAFLFLITGPASMTGQVLAVDGGRSARGL